MTTGIINYLSPRGLGTMTHDLRVQLGIEHQMVVPDAGWANVPEWATGQEFYLQKWEVDIEDLVAWKQVYGIDHIVCIETGFGDRTFEFAKSLGMRTSLIVMWEAFNPNMNAYKHVDLYLCPSFKAFQEVPFDRKLYLPYPVDTNAIKFRERMGPAKTFVHNAGSGGMNGRKGTRETLQAFQSACRNGLHADLLVRSQVPLEQIVPEFMDYMKPRVFRVEGSVPFDRLYDEGDVLVYPSRYDGHALVTLEAMAAGMPVITTNAEPMNEYWGRESRKLLVKVARREKPSGLVNPHCQSNIVSVEDLAKKMLWCAQPEGGELGEISRNNRRIAEEEHSWAMLRDRWKSKLNN